jgi:hypothetical protein
MDGQKVKTIVWGVIAVVAIVALAWVTVAGEEGSLKLLLAFLGGMAVPGSPLGALLVKTIDGGGPKPPTGPIMLTALALALALGSGCSASALRTHRMADGITGIVLASGRSVLGEAGGEAIAACNGDEACEEERGEQVADALAAFDAADAARGAYHVAISVAREVGEGDYLAAVGQGAMGLLVAYYRIRSVMCRLGHEWPEPPRLLIDAVTWAAGSPLPEVPDCVLAGGE